MTKADDYEDCPYCQGNGRKPSLLNGKWHSTTCSACGGIGTRGAMRRVLDENSMINRQLIKRYGTVSPNSIKDFWQ